MKKIYIIGASGYLGAGAAAYFQTQGFSVITDHVDVTNLPALQDAFAKHRPNAVINCAGVRTEPNIDWCESHQTETVAVNVVGATNVMLAALQVDAYPIQIASGCIYAGPADHYFTEEDEPNFHGSFYSRMKIALEAVIGELPVAIAQIRMPLSTQPHPRNLITKLASYRQVISVPNSMTLVEDLYPALAVLIEQQAIGTFHLTNQGAVTHGEILAAYQAVVDPTHHFELISVAEMEANLVIAKRSNCVLSNDKATKLGIHLPTLDEARLHAIMETYKAKLI